MEIGNKLPAEKGKPKASPAKAADKVAKAAPPPPANVKVKADGKGHAMAGLTLNQIAQSINKADPGGILRLDEVVLVARASTGVFPIDYQTGGGWLRGRINIVWAKEGAGKSLLCYLTIAADQVINPNKYQVIIDIEGRLDREWITSLVPQPDKVVIIQPVTVEEAIDKAEAVIMGVDVSIVIFDSIAMLTTENELNSAAEKASVGGASNPIGKLMRKMTARLNELKRLNRHPAVILVNQVRHAIGQLWGNPEKQPGGNAPKFMSSMTLWLHSKNESEKSSQIVNWKATTCTLHKWTTKVLAVTSEYNVCTANVFDPGTGEIHYKPGDVYDWPLVKRELERLGLLVKDAKEGYNVMIYKEPKWFRVLSDVQDYYLAPENKLEYFKLKQALIEVALVKTHGIPPQPQPA